MVSKLFELYYSKITVGFIVLGAIVVIERSFHLNFSPFGCIVVGVLENIIALFVQDFNLLLFLWPYTLVSKFY